MKTPQIQVPGVPSARLMVDYTRHSPCLPTVYEVNAQEDAGPEYRGPYTSISGHRIKCDGSFAIPPTCRRDPKYINQYEGL